MPKKPRIPSYRLHKPSGLAVVRIDGKDHYLGKHESEKSHKKYRRLISEWLTSSIPPRPEISNSAPTTSLSVSQLVLKYWEFAKEHYVKDDQPTDEQYAIRAAMRPLLDLYGESSILEFGPLALKAVREEMINRDLCRATINQNIGKIRRMFKWGVENELVPETIHRALITVVGLRKGRTRARENISTRGFPLSQIVFRSSPVFAIFRKSTKKM